MSAVPSLHATCVVIGEAGILIRGESGAGKSSLALALLHHAALSGRFARLVADDRVSVTVRAGRLVARPLAATAGLVERRGTGLLRLPHEPAAVLRLVVDCVAAPPRLPSGTERSVSVYGCVLTRLWHRIDDDPLGVVGPVLSAVADTLVTE